MVPDYTPDRHYGRSRYRGEHYTPCGKWAADVVATYDQGLVTCPACLDELRTTNQEGQA